MTGYLQVESRQINIKGKKVYKLFFFFFLVASHNILQLSLFTTEQAHLLPFLRKREGLDDSWMEREGTQC